MRFFTARRLALVAALPVLLTFTFIPGCSEESEGERCGDMLGPNSADCASGLTCIQIDSSNGGIFRCCNPDRVTNSRCVPVVSSGAAGSGGSAGASGSGGNAGGDVAGTGGDVAGTAGASAGQSSVTPEAGAGGA